jgi:hypothetical protein
MYNKHAFAQGKHLPTCCHKHEDGTYCNKRAKHLIHKMPKPVNYTPGEVVGRYYVHNDGSFRRIKEA